MKLKSAEFVNALSATFETLNVATQADVVSQTSEFTQDSLSADQATISALSATFEQLSVLTRATFTADRTVFDVDQGHFVLFAAFFDTFYIEDGTRPSDQFILDFFKPLVDDAAVADVAARAVTKVLNDAGYFTDIQRVAFVKRTVESIGVSDPYYFEFAKALNEIVADVTDVASLNPNKVANDTTSTTDSTLFDLGLNKTDTPVVLDEPAFNVGKPLLDDGLVLEAHTLAFAKVLADQVASTEDHVVIFTKKAADEVVASIDLLQKNFGTSFADASTLAEAHAIATGKSIAELVASVGDQTFLFAKKVQSDDVSFDEAVTVDTGLGKSETPIVLDEPALSVGKPLSDAYSVAELHALAVAKSFADDAAGAEDLTLLYTKKAAEEVIASVDLIQKTFGTSFSEITSLEDAHAVATSKPFVELLAGIADQTSLAVSKPLTETVGSTDADVIAFAKALAEHGYVSEAIDTLTFGKTLTEAPAASDVINTLGIAKLLTDSVYFTDDVDGNASILDDQEMQFRKNVSHVAAVTDVFTKSIGFTRAFTDASSADDAHQFGFAKALQDALGAIDSINKVTGKQIYDIPVASETLAKALTKALSTDSALLGDAISLQMGYNRAFADTSAASDSDQLSVGKGLSDSSGVSESKYVVTAKQLYDAPSATENLAKSFTKAPFLDSALIGDAAIVSPGKGLLSSTSSTDAGSLRSQGYSDFSYFAEDFVGASTTF